MSALSDLIASKLSGSGGGGGGGSVTSVNGQTGAVVLTAADLDDSFKDALLDCFANVAWATEDGQQYYDALEAALYPIDHITAAYTQSGTVYDTDSIDSLKADLVVTAFYQGGGSKVVTDYTLSGTLTEGTSTITVSYGGKTATFDVLVEHDPSILPDEYQQVEWIEANKGPVIDTNNPLTENSEIHARMQVMGAGTASYAGLFGRTTPSILAMHSADGHISFNFARASSLLNVAMLGFNEPHDLTLNKTECLVDGVVKGTFTGGMTAITEQRNLLIFAWNDTDSPYGPTRQGYARCYSLQIYDAGVLVTDLVPCYRKADGVIGMYDRAAQAFRTNIGTGTFTKGADV